MEKETLDKLKDIALNVIRNDVMDYCYESIETCYLDKIHQAPNLTVDDKDAIEALKSVYNGEYDKVEQFVNEYMVGNSFILYGFTANGGSIFQIYYILSLTREEEWIDLETKKCDVTLIRKKADLTCNSESLDCLPLFLKWSNSGKYNVDFKDNVAKIPNGLFNEIFNRCKSYTSVYAELLSKYTKQQ